MKRVGTLAAVGLLGCLFTANTASASGFYHALTSRYTASGALDTTYNGTGKVMSTVASYALDVETDSAGKVVGCGSFVTQSSTNQLLVGRNNSNGTADTTFGFLGVTTVSWPRETSARACTIDANGKIVVASTDGPSSSGSILLTRFNSNGSLDTTFGSAGFAVLRGV